jgi:hypothetical protein
VSKTAISGAYTPRGYYSFVGDPARAPFRTWVEDRQLNPKGFDNQRLDAILDRTAGMGSHRGGRGLQHDVSSPQLAWEARRRHTPCSIRIYSYWDMDTLYLRGVEEERYFKALSEFTANAPLSIDADLHREYLFHSRPFLSRTGLPLDGRPSTLRGNFLDEGRSTYHMWPLHATAGMRSTYRA